jgi:outer membrane protein assembly factor BamB
VLVGGHVYAGHGHNRGFPICVDLATGRVAWGGDIRNAGHRLGGGDVRGRAALLPLRERRRRADRGDPEGYREKGSFTIPGVRNPSWAHLAIADGRLYVREQDTLYCYDLRSSRSAGSGGGAPAVAPALPMQ